ncbi:MAG: CHAT domain-containing tetratricopeptide repeat protein [Bryobacteraceae bacterium]|jgi:CHAT domain-containing protein/Flp pilus assembly protein TadD
MRFGVYAIVAGAAVLLLMAQPPSGAKSFQLGAGDVLRGSAIQQTADLIVVLRRPGGTKVTEFDSFEEGGEPVCFVADQSGEYELEVRLAESDKPTVTDVLSIEPPHPSSEADRLFCRAVEQSTAAKKLQEKGGANSLQEAAGRNSTALELWRELGDRASELRTLNKLGTVQHSLSQYAAARETFSEALSLSNSLGDRRSEGEALNGAGMASFRLGEVQPSINYLKQALALWDELHSTYGQASALNNLGVIFYPMGEWQTAIDYHLRSLDLIRSLGDRLGEAYTLNNLGVAYDALGQPETAARYLRDALRLFRATGARAAAGRTLGVMGRIALAEDDLKTALSDEEEALSLARGEGDRRSEAEELEHLGEIWDKRQDGNRATQFYRDSLAKFQAVSNRPGEALALHQLGLAEIRQGAASSGMELLNQALKIRTDTGLRDRVAVSLLDMARVERERGNLGAARERVEAALDCIEALRTRVAEPSLRTSYFASKGDWYSFYIDLLMQLHRQSPERGFDRSAFNAAERFRARSFLDILAEMQGQIRKGGDPVLLERERGLQRELNLESNQLLALAAASPTPREVVLRRQLDATLTRLQQVEMHIRTENPRYASLTQPRPVSINEIQRTLLDTDTLLLEYSLAADTSYLWVVATDSVHSYALPGRAAIETEALRYLEAASQRDSGADANRAGKTLSGILLAPAQGLLGRKRLLILADGGLLAIPFAALPAPGGDTPLVVKHEIVTAPSLSALALWRQEKPSPRPAASTALVIADPVFDRQDPRVTGDAAAMETWPVPAPLARLPFTSDEARVVAAVLPPTHTKLALGFDARKSLLTGPDAARFGILHIATHGLFDARSPELSGLVFSRVDATGREQDGFLRLYEIFNLGLHADLVVLSACRSGLGRYVRGEGVLGLTRAFMYAGAPRIVVAQWNVDDEATAELMRHFYKFQFGPSRMRPAAALRAAQVAMWEQPHWRSPYFWGAFVFHGEWR